MNAVARIVRERVPEFFRTAFLSFAMRFSGLLVQFVASIIAARILGPEGFGAFTYAFIVASMLGMAMSLGLAELSVRELPTYLSRDEPHHVLGYLATTISTIGVTGVIVGIILSTLERTETLTLAPGWFLVTIMAVSLSLILTISSALNAFRRLLTSQFMEAIFRQVVYLALVGLALLLGYAVTPASLFIIALVAIVPTLFIMVAVLVGMYRQSAPAPVRPAMEPRRWATAALPLFAASFASVMQFDIDVLMVGAFLGDYDVGLYRAAARGAILVLIANTIAMQLVGPMLSRALAEDNSEEAQRLLSQAAMTTLMISMPILLILGVGGWYYLSLFGPEFVGATTSLRLLLLTQAFIVFAGADSVLLVMLKRERTVLVLTVIGVAMNIVLNLLLIGPLGMEGAAIASVISMGFVRATSVFVILTSTEYDTTLMSILRRWQKSR